MEYLQNHIWCSDSNWGGEYDCRHVVDIASFGPDADDWVGIVDDEVGRHVDQEVKEMLERASVLRGKALCPMMYSRPVHGLRPHVYQWLVDNVKDRKDDQCEKGWCIGSLEYRARDTNVKLAIFFHRKSDAMAFIRKFSKYGKPTRYCQYFTDDRKVLNLETMKYEKY